MQPARVHQQVHGIHDGRSVPEMRAMVLHEPGEPLREERAARIRVPGPGQVLLEVRGLRRLPHRPPRGGRRAARPEAAARARPPDRGPGGGGRRALRRRRPGGGAVARLDRRRVPRTAARAARTSATAPASPGTRSTAATPSGWWPTSASASRFRRAIPDLQAAPLLCAGLIGYRALRLAGDADAPRPLRLRRRGAHHRPGRAPPGPARVRLHARRRRGGQAFARELGAEWAGRLGAARRPRSWTRR